MKILHITPHFGGGVGTVIRDWMDKVIAANDHDHSIISLDHVNKKTKDWAIDRGFPYLTDLAGVMGTMGWVYLAIEESDIVLVHYWDHPMLVELLSKPLPNCRMVFWCHKNYSLKYEELQYPDRFYFTSPVQYQKNTSVSIWSTGNMERFLAIEPKPHKGFNIGTVVSKKMDIPKTMELFMEVARQMEDAHFIWIGDAIPVNFMDSPFRGSPNFIFTGKVDDVAPYLAEMDVFAYPLRPDHYGTCEIALGEAMCAGVVPVVMDNPAEKKIVWHMDNGLMASTPEVFVKKIIKFRDMPERKQLQEGARERGKKLYNINTMIASWDEVFNEMMSPKTGFALGIFSKP